jgi:transposase
VGNQIRRWLALCGVARPRERRASWWTQVRDGAGAPRAAELQARIARAEERLAVIERQLQMVSAVQEAAVREAAPDSALRALVRMKGIAVTGASVLLDEGLVWRAFRHRRQVGGMLGFGPVPYQSGEQARTLGIDRAGNRRWRAISVQLAWNWVQWQPTSALPQWFQRVFGDRGARARRIGIVALARKLLIALWRYVTTGELPAGAVLKSA